MTPSTSPQPEERDERPKISALDLLGIAPDWTGPGTTDQFIAHERERCESDCPYCAEEQR